MSKKRKTVQATPELSTRTLPLRLDTGGRPASLDEQTRSVEIVAATEAPVTIYDWELGGRVSEILLMSGMRPVDNVRLLDSHNRWDTSSVLGTVKDFRVEGDRLLARAYYSSVEEADKAYTKTREGHLTDYSVGYRVNAYLRVMEGETAQHDGRDFTGPCLVATDWELKEVSTCPIGADESAKARALAAHNKEDHQMDKRLRKLLGLPEDATEEQVLAEIEKRNLTLAEMQARAADPAPKPETAKPAKGESAEDAARKAVETERLRVSEIDALCAQHGCEGLRAQLVSEGTSVADAQRKVLAAIAERGKQGEQPGFRVEAGPAERDKFRAAATDSLFLRGGLVIVGQPAPGADDLRSMGLRELARECLVRAGQPVSGNILDIVGRALTTSDLPNILANVASKSLLEGWDAANETWSQWCAEGSLPDFKAATLARAGEADDLDEVKEGAEYEYGSLDDTKETVQLTTYGKLFAITRQAIINDDLGQITEVPSKMGEAAARKIGDLPYAVLIANSAMGDNTALFHTDHGNLASSAAAIDVTPLNVAFKSMAIQTDLSGKRRLNIRPTFLLAPVSIMGAAEQFFKTDKIGGVSNKPNLANIYAGDVLTRIYEARLDDGSVTAWFLAGPKGKTVKVFFLNGQNRPYMESRQGWSVDGTEFKVRIDGVAKALDYRGLFKNAGA